MTCPFRVALTFDTEHPDRPRTDPGNARALVATLAEQAVRATFFLQGRWVEAYPEVAQTIAADGHLVGDHSFYHARMPLLTDAGSQRTLPTQVRSSAKRPVSTRGPGSAARSGWVSTTRVSSPRSPGPATRTSTGTWTARTGTRPTMPRASSARSSTGRWPTGDGAIVLLHAWPDATLGAIAGIVGRLREAGATFVTVDALVSRSA